jgi:hypothetical protein
LVLRPFWKNRVGKLQRYRRPSPKWVRDLFRSDTQPEQSYSGRQQPSIGRPARLRGARITETDAIKESKWNMKGDIPGPGRTGADNGQEASLGKIARRARMDARR